MSMSECKCCGKTFEPNSASRLYCSQECYNVVNRERARKKNAILVEKKCAYCGKPFIKTANSVVNEYIKGFGRTIYKAKRDLEEKYKNTIY